MQWVLEGPGRAYGLRGPGFAASGLWLEQYGSSLILGGLYGWFGSRVRVP